MDQPHTEVNAYQVHIAGMHSVTSWANPIQDVFDWSCTHVVSVPRSSDVVRGRGPRSSQNSSDSLHDCSRVVVGVCVFTLFWSSLVGTVPEQGCYQPVTELISRICLDSAPRRIMRQITLTLISDTILVPLPFWRAFSESRFVRM